MVLKCFVPWYTVRFITVDPHNDVLEMHNLLLPPHPSIMRLDKDTPTLVAKTAHTSPINFVFQPGVSKVRYTPPQRPLLLTRQPFIPPTPPAPIPIASARSPSITQVLRLLLIILLIQTDTQSCYQREIDAGRDLHAIRLLSEEDVLPT